MSTPNWNEDTRVCLDWAGKKFQSNYGGLLYLWQAETWIGARNDDRKPFFMAKPLGLVPGQTAKPGRPISRMVVFHAEHLVKTTLVP